jgi:START domain-containing protein
LQPSSNSHGVFLWTLALVLFSCFTVWGQRDCVLKKDRDSIKVYTCPSGHLKFKSIKASFTVNARLSQLVAFILDINNYCDWQYHTVKARLLKKINEQEVVYYTEIAAPWPVSNRDMVIDLQVSQDTRTKVLTITSKSVTGWVPEKDHLVRVPMSQGSWTVVPISSSLLKVEYFVLIDPGGSVPAWMINMVAAQAPYDSFKILKDKIQQKKFMNSRVPFILDY